MELLAMEEIISRELLEILPILENPEITDSDSAIICRRNEKFFNVDDIKANIKRQVLGKKELLPNLFYVSIFFEWEGTQKNWSRITKTQPKDFILEQDILYKHWRITLPLGLEHLDKSNYCFSALENNGNNYVTLRDEQGKVAQTRIECIGKVNKLWIYRKR
jgi:hypothetical protein